MIDGVTDTQGYNRYSYVHNNPLNATDPSGFSAWTRFRDNFLKPVIQGIITFHCIPCGTALAAATTAYYGGDAFDVAVAAFSTYVMASMGQQFAAGGGFSAGDAFVFGVTGGITSTLRGGKFGHGFVSAYTGAAVNASGILKGASQVEQFGASIVIAGAISEATGGKFANWAAYAAFSWAVAQGARSVASNKGSNSFAEQGESEFYTTDENGNKTQTPEQRRRQLKHLGVKEGSPSRSEKAEISAILSTDEFQAIADPIADAALECGCEPTALRVTEVEGVYFVDRIGSGTSGLRIDFIPEPLGFKNWRHVFDWHPHPGGTPLPSPSDLLTSQSQGTNNALWYGNGKHTIYRGE